MTKHKDAILLVARLCMASLFVFSGAEKLLMPSLAAKYASMHGVPAAEILVPIASAFEIVAALALITGYRAQWAAIALAIWMLIVGPWFHQFWELSGSEWQDSIDSFFHHFVMIGGMLCLVVGGPGAFVVRFGTRTAPVSRQ